MTLAQAANISIKESEILVQTLSLSQLSNDSSDIHVNVAIGIFETVINGQTYKEPREGLKSVLGFAMISIVSTGIVLIQSAFVTYIWIVADTCPINRCNFCFRLIWFSFHCYSAGTISAGTACAVFGFSADGTGKESHYGHSFYLLFASAIPVAIIAVILLIFMLSRHEEMQDEIVQRRRNISLAGEYRPLLSAENNCESGQEEYDSLSKIEPINNQDNPNEEDPTHAKMPIDVTCLPGPSKNVDEKPKKENIIRKSDKKNILENYKEGLLLSTQSDNNYE
ncbi:uncharacterized protein LOC144744091 [Ciona intestinalis]